MIKFSYVSLKMLFYCFVLSQICCRRFIVEKALKLESKKKEIFLTTVFLFFRKKDIKKQMIFKMQIFKKKKKLEKSHSLA